MQPRSFVRTLAGVLAGIIVTATAVLGPAVQAQSGTQQLGDTAYSADGTAVTVWDGYPTPYVGPRGGPVYAVSVSVCTGLSPSPDSQQATTSHFDLIVPPMQSGMVLPGFFDGGWGDAVLGPNQCNAGWIAFEVPPGLHAVAINYHEVVCDPAIVGTPLPARCIRPPDGFWPLP